MMKWFVAFFNKKSNRIAEFLVFLFSILALAPLKSNDIWWHLKYGEWVWKTMSLSIQDPFSWTHFGQPTASMPWLSGLLFYLVYLIAGIGALVVLKALISLFAYSACLLIHRNEKNLEHWFCVVLFFSGWLILSRLVLLRGLVTMFLLFGILVFCWNQAKKKNKAVWYACIPLILFVWSNGHGSPIVPLTWLTLALFWPFLWSQPHKKKILLAFLFWGLTVLVTFAHPASWRTWNFVLSSFTGSTGWSYHLTQEEQSMTWSLLIGQRVPVFVLGLLSLPALCSLSWRKHGPEFLFWLILWGQMFQKKRLIGLVGLVALIWLPSWLSELERSNKVREKKAFQWTKITLLLVCFMAPFWMIWYQYSNQAPIVPSTFGLRTEHRKFPSKITLFLKKYLPQGRLYNSPFSGGYLMWHLPSRKVFADGRTNILYSKSFFYRTYGRHYIGKTPLTKTLDDMNIGIAVLEHGTLSNQLFKEENWVPVVYDDYYVLYLKKQKGNDHLIERFGYSHFFLSPNIQMLYKHWLSLRKSSLSKFQALQKESHRALLNLPYESKHLRVANQILESLSNQE